MEVTKSNFLDALPIVKKAIEDCDFLALDTEMTGLHTEFNAHAFDTMDERYIKMYETAKNFLVIQVGISCFKYHKESKKYTHKDFNFYVFPRQHCSHVPDTFFTGSASAFNFLISHDFDFNKLLREGISYLTPAQEEKVKSQLKTAHTEKVEALSNESKDKKDRKKTSIEIPDEHKEFIQEIHQQIDAYVSGESKERISLPSCGPYRRKLIYETVLPKYSSGLTLTTSPRDGKPQFITVDKMTNSEKIVELEKKHLTDMNDLEDAVGFRKVLDTISQTKKLVLGHNMQLDLFHIIHQFYHPVPETLMEYKELLKCIFPHIADTKTLASTGFKSLGMSTVLFELPGEMESHGFRAPSIEADETVSECYQLDAGKMHEAGYDAFMTGVVFIRLKMRLAEENKLDDIDIKNRILSPYVNRPYVMRHFDIQSLNLNGPDPEGNRNNVFHVLFPKTWKTGDLTELFLPYGEIHICWIDDVSAFVALKSPEQSVNAKRALCNDPSTIYKVLPYYEYQERQSLKNSVPHQNQPLKIPDLETALKKRRSNSGGSLESFGLSRSITPIIEEEEELDNKNGIDKQEHCVSTSHGERTNEACENALTRDSPKPKRLKIDQEDAANHEVSSTEKMFEEPATW